MGEPVTTKAPGAEPAGAPPIDLSDPPEAKATSVLPTDGFHDSREVSAAMQAGKPTQDGYPLHPQAQERIKGIQAAIDGIRGWADWAQGELSKAASIGTGH